MAGLAAIAMVAGTAISAVGTIAAGNVAARQQVLAGQAQKAANDFQAKQFEVRAKNERAAAQRSAQEIGRQKRLALSRNQAVAAAGGFSADDASTLDIQGQIEKFGAYQEAMAQYGGNAAADADLASAKASRAAGANALTIGQESASATRMSSFLNAAGTIVGGASSMFQKYGMAYTPAVTSNYAYG